MGPSFDYTSTLKLIFKIGSLFKKVHVLAALMDPCQKDWSTLNKYISKIPNSKVPDTFQLKDDVDNPTTFVDIIYQVMQSHKIDECPSTSAGSGEPPAKKDAFKKINYFLYILIPN